MTNEEAITILTQIKRDTEIRDFQAETLDMAISALTEKKPPYIAQIAFDLSLIADFIEKIKNVCINDTVEIEGKTYISAERILSVLTEKEK